MMPNPTPFRFAPDRRRRRRSLGAIARNAGVALGLAVALGAGLTGCHTPKTSDASIEFVNPEQARGMLGGQRGLLGLGKETVRVAVDARSKSDYEAEHLPGAIHIPLDRTRQDLSSLDVYDGYIVYGDGYNAPAALAMTKVLIERGFANVKALRGGLRGWKSAGLPTEGTDVE